MNVVVVGGEAVTVVMGESASIGGMDGNGSSAVMAENRNVGRSVSVLIEMIGGNVETVCFVVGVAVVGMARNGIADWVCCDLSGCDDGYAVNVGKFVTDRRNEEVMSMVDGHRRHYF